jgi:hypothetical protein
VPNPGPPAWRLLDVSNMDQHYRLFSKIQGKVLLAAFAATCLGVTAPAHADEYERDDGVHESRRDRDTSKTHIAVDGDFNAAVNAAEVDAGAGGALRLGQEFDLFLISLTPELGGGYHGFGGDDRLKLYSGFLGGRLAVGKIVEPSLFAHVGVGRLDGPDPRTAPMLDGGLAIDFTLLPLLDLGVHGAYNVLLPEKDGDSFKFVTLGAQAALVL